MNKIALLLLSLLLPLYLHAADPIVGAFGLKLGDKFDVKTTELKLPPSRPDDEIGPLIPNQPIGLVYKISPAAPNANFVEYYVVITPETHVICQIIANGIEKDTGSRNALVNLICSFLNKKYGSGIATPQKSIVQRDGRGVVVELYKNSFRGIEDPAGGYSICYFDNALCQQSQEESKNYLQKERENRLKSLNTDGL